MWMELLFCVWFKSEKNQAGSQHWEQCSGNAKCKMSMGNHRPPLSEKGSIVSLNGDHNENCARNVNSRGHSEMCAEMC